jgi:hypothetical protein
VKNVGLAWVKLIKNTQFAAVGFESVRPQEQERASSSMLRAASQLSQASQQSNRSKSPQKKKKAAKKEPYQLIADALVSLFKSDRLQHIDLSECGLTSEVLLQLIRPIRRSKSLLGVHFTGNPGLSFDVESKILSKLQVTQDKKLAFISFQQTLNKHRTGPADLRTQV